MEITPPLIWFIAGVAFMIAEVLVPGFVLIFFTFGCWFTALFALLAEINLTTQILFFITLSLLLLFTLRKFCINTFRGIVIDNINDMCSESKIGRTAIATEPISSDVPGEIKVTGSFWRAVSDTPIEVGQSVLIVSQEPNDKLTYKVKPLNNGRNT